MPSSPSGLLSSIGYFQANELLQRGGEHGCACSINLVASQSKGGQALLSAVVRTLAPQHPLRQGR